MSSAQPPSRRALSVLRGQSARVADAAALTGLARLAWLGPLWSVYAAYDVLAWDAAGGALPSAPWPQGIQPRWLSTAGLDLLSDFNPRWPVAELERRLAEGQEAVVWLQAGRPVHCRWLATRDAYLPYLGRRVRPAAGDLLSVEAYTPPEHRRRGLYEAGTAWTLAEIRRRGLRRGLFLVAGWNRPVRSLLERIGLERVGRIERFGLGPLRRWRIRGRLRWGSAGSFEVAAAEISA